MKTIIVRGTRGRLVLCQYVLYLIMGPRCLSSHLTCSAEVVHWLPTSEVAFDDCIWLADTIFAIS